MSKPFLIRHRDGREYELNSVAVYKREYMPHGFALVDPQPADYERPDLSEKRADDAPAEQQSTDTDPDAGDGEPRPQLHAPDGDAGRVGQRRRKRDGDDE